jgi:hypothetical protein
MSQLSSSPNTQQSNTDPLPRLGARVVTPAGEGVFRGAAYTLKRGTLEIDELTAEVMIQNGRYFFAAHEIREA